MEKPSPRPGGGFFFTSLVNLGTACAQTHLCWGPALIRSAACVQNVRRRVFATKICSCPIRPCRRVALVAWPGPDVCRPVTLHVGPPRRIRFPRLLSALSRVTFLMKVAKIVTGYG